MAAAQPPELNFLPKQATPRSAVLFESIIGTTSEDVNHHILTSRLGPIAPNTILHDNGGGPLQAPIQLFKSTPSNPNPADSLIIHATDSNGFRIEATKAKAAAHNFPIKTFVLRHEELSFPSNTFDISVTNFVITTLVNPELAAQRLYNTLKPGGKAVISTWASLPHDLPVKKAHAVTRGEGASPRRITWAEDTLMETYLRNFYLSGGFEEEKIDIRQFSTPHRVPDVRIWAEGLWSFMGDLKEGWTKTDEEKWGVAVQTIIDEVKKSEGYVADGKGAVLQFVAHIGVATK